MRKGFNFYKSYWDVANELCDEDRLKFYDAILKRQFTGEETELKGMVKFAYLSQKHSIDRQIDGYLSQKKKSHPTEDPWQGGVQGGTKGPWQQEKEKEEVKEKVKRNIFKHPTIEEVQNYCLERNNNVDAKRWYDFYVSKGWLVGKSKMRDWKASVRTWEKETNVSPKQPNFKSNDQIFYENVMKQLGK